MTADTLITNATVIDGSGSPGFPADVAITDGVITAVDTVRGNTSAARRIDAAERVIDAEGRVLCPGFIDMHAHSDLQILTNPDHTAKVSQGVTTEVLGQDGLSFAPVDASTREALRSQISGWNGKPDEVTLEWDSVAGYLDRLDEGIACNAAYLVPQGTIRMMVVGSGDRAASSAELAAMMRLVVDGMRAGAFGMSSGLTYPPGMFADTSELVSLCRAVAECGGYFSPHHRSYGAGALSAYREMLHVARQSGCPLHLTHATMNFAPNDGRAGELLELIDEALSDGIDVSLDSYPYESGATTLSALLPSRVMTDGPEALLESLADPSRRADIAHELEHVGTDGCHGCVVEWDTIEISGVVNPDLADRVGSSVADLARAEGRDAHDVYFDLLTDDRLATTILQHVGHEENVRTIMQHRTHCGGSDGILVGDRPHPRAWGTFPRYLARYVRELGVLDLPDCIHHLTGRPARRLGLRTRGLVRAGYAADLVVFDPDTVRDTASYAHPRQQARGIEWVFVNGVAAIDRGVRTDSLSGYALRHGQDPAH